MGEEEELQSQERQGRGAQALPFYLEEEWIKAKWPYYLQLLVNHWSLTKEDAEDVIVLSFQKATTADFTGSSHQAAHWLLRILLNNALDLLRHRGTLAMISLDRLLGWGQTDGETTYTSRDLKALNECLGPGPEEDLLKTETQQEQRAALDTMLTKLPHRTATTLQLRAEESTYQEIAGRMDTSIPAVKSMLFRAREELRPKLAYLRNEHAPVLSKGDSP